MEPDRRKSHRENAILAAACRVRGIAYRTRLTDVSQGGCRASWSGDRAEPGERVVLQVGLLLVIPAVIRWVQDGAVGLEFANPVLGAMLSRLADHSGEGVARMP